MCFGGERGITYMNPGGGRNQKKQISHCVLSFFIPGISLRQAWLMPKMKNAPWRGHLFSLAEREGFEPPEPHGSTVFKTAAIDHSAISPGAKVEEKLFHETSDFTFF